MAKNLSDHSYEARIAIAYGADAIGRYRHPAEITAGHILYGIALSNIGKGAELLRMHVMAGEIFLELEKVFKLPDFPLRPEVGKRLGLTFSEDAEELVAQSRLEAERRQAFDIKNAHQLLAILHLANSIPHKILRDLNVDIESLEKDIVAHLKDR